LFREDTGITFPLLVDDESKSYHAINLKKANIFHLFRGDTFAARKRAKSAGHRQRKLGRDPFQLGASFVFAPGNVDRFAHISETFGDNAKVEELLMASLWPNSKTDARSPCPPDTAIKSPTTPIHIFLARWMGLSCLWWIEGQPKHRFRCVLIMLGQITYNLRLV